MSHPFSGMKNLKLYLINAKNAHLQKQAMIKVLKTESTL